jgi:regulator of protease activity HflC (stomatin/prohibitin superfamily)
LRHDFATSADKTSYSKQNNKSAGVWVMSGRLDAVLEVVRRLLTEPLGRLFTMLVGALSALLRYVHRQRSAFVITVAVLAIGYAFYRYPPFATARRGDILLRANALDGSVEAYTAGSVLAIPGIHQVRSYPTSDQIYRSEQSTSATGAAPFQTNEGLSIGVDLTVRWAIDRGRITRMSKEFPDDLNADLVGPAVQGIVYPLLARHSVREIFSDQRAAIQQEIGKELTPKLWKMGLLLRGVDMGKVDLPSDYRAGMERLLAEELETEKIRYTLQLKEAQVKQTELEAEAEKVRREKAAEAAGQEQVIAARAQEESMQHILPFKQKQIEQRQLEAEAEKVARIRSAEGSAEARRIEAKGEADSRQKLADAEAYRLDLVGKANSSQMEREGALIARYPLLIQKTLADKLSDKIQVIIAPPAAAGRFIGSTLIATPGTASDPPAAANSEEGASSEEGAQ